MGFTGNISPRNSVEFFHPYKFHENPRFPQFLVESKVETSIFSVGFLWVFVGCHEGCVFSGCPPTVSSKRSLIGYAWGCHGGGTNGFGIRCPKNAAFLPQNAWLFGWNRDGCKVHPGNSKLNLNGRSCTWEICGKQIFENGVGHFCDVM